ncbi:hypothetical protein PIB30_008772 [Stylosanthes scabra]|uniref:Uncharacterized protein n=1 Tax=Stylosanthes scabra TaxID=79078 RepID=A0ABU6W8I2_9FABA|nr:hypothetical protein [Stylosanthes scabra]
MLTEHSTCMDKSGRTDPIRQEKPDPTCPPRKRCDTISPLERNRRRAPTSTSKPQDMHFLTINDTGSTPSPRACSIENSTIGFTATAHTWTELGLFGFAFTPEQ